MTQVIKTSPVAAAGVVVGENSVRISGTESSGIIMDNRGLSINSPISIGSGAAQMRFGIMWTMNSEMALQIPSTTATPTPVMMINPPFKGIASLVKDVSSAAALLP
jgi:hypothetical protein